MALAKQGSDRGSKCKYKGYEAVKGKGTLLMELRWR